MTLETVTPQTSTAPAPITVASITLSQGLMCLSLPGLVILDWDARQLVDAPRSVESGGPTVDSREEALGLVAADVLQYPQDLWALYSTKQGLRGLLLSESYTPDNLLTRFEIMRPDPIYLRRCREQKQWVARVSRKLHREPDTDKIQFLGVLGQGTPNREMVEGLKLHHFLLLQNRMTDRELVLNFTLPPREVTVIPKLPKGVGKANASTAACRTSDDDDFAF